MTLTSGSLLAAGDIEALLAHNRTLFGDLRMEDTGGDGDAGGDGDGDIGDGDDAGADGEDGTDGDDAAERALTAERQSRKAAVGLLAELTGKSKAEVNRLIKKGDLTALKPAADGKDGKDGKDEPDADAIRREAEREADEKATARLVRAEVRALAAETFANPADALHNLDLTDYELTDDGDLADPKKVKADLAKVLRDYPHYAKKGAGPRPDTSQGKGGGEVEVQPGMGRLRAAYANKK